MLDDVRIRKRSDVAGVHTIGNGGENAAHDFAGTRFGHVRHHVNPFWPRNFSDHGLDGLRHFVDHLLVGLQPRLDGNINLRDAALDFIDHRNHRGLGNFRHGQARGFNFFCTQAMPGDVDYVIDAAQDAIVAVGGNHGAIAGEVRPVAPIGAVRIFTIFCIVLFRKAFRIAPDGLHDSRPGIANANIASGVLAGLHFLAVFVPNHRINSQRRRSRAARLHGIERRLGGAQKSAGFRLPPGIDDCRLAFAHRFVIPAPDLRLDRFADRGHVLEFVVVLGGFIRAGFAQHANRGRRSVKNVDVQAFRNAPRASGIRKLRHAFINNAGGGERQRTVDNIGMPGDPADVRHAPVHVAGMNVLVIL